MSKHISYEKRREEPIYIGFDEQDSRQKKKKTPKSRSNGFAAASAFFGVLGMLTTVTVFPFIFAALYKNGLVERPPLVVYLAIPAVSLLFSVLAILLAAIGIFRKPRFLAVVGGFLGLIPIGSLVGLNQYAESIMHRHDRDLEHRVELQLTEKQMNRAVAKIDDYRIKHEQNPDGLEGNRIVIHFTDAWKKELRYEPTESGFTIRSAGRDGKFETGDDMVKKSVTTNVFVSATGDVGAPSPPGPPAKN